MELSEIQRTFRQKCLRLALRITGNGRRASYCGHMEQQMKTNADIVIQYIQLVAHVEALTEKWDLRPPIEVSVVDNHQGEVEFGYSPESEELDLPAMLLVLPIRLTLTDTNDKQVEVQLPDLAPLSEWSKRFQQ